jgi:hypothetical protein
VADPLDAAFDQFCTDAHMAATALFALLGPSHGRVAMTCFVALRYLEHRHKTEASREDWEQYERAKAELSKVLDRTDQTVEARANAEAS